MKGIPLSVNWKILFVTEKIILRKTLIFPDCLRKESIRLPRKLGEEAVELVIEAKDRNDHLFLNEAADLLFHYLILLEARGHNFNEVTNVLQVRHDKKSA